jgi:hypothetical protein
MPIVRWLETATPAGDICNPWGEILVRIKSDCQCLESLHSSFCSKPLPGSGLHGGCPTPAREAYSAATLSAAGSSEHEIHGPIQWALACTCGSYSFPRLHRVSFLGEDEGFSAKTCCSFNLWRHCAGTSISWRLRGCTNFTRVTSDGGRACKGIIGLFTWNYLGLSSCRPLSHAHLE